MLPRVILENNQIAEKTSFQEGSLQKDSNSCLLQNVWTTLLTDPERHMFKVRQSF